MQRHVVSIGVPSPQLDFRFCILVLGNFVQQRHHRIVHDQVAEHCAVELNRIVGQHLVVLHGAVSRIRRCIYDRFWKCLFYPLENERWFDFVDGKMNDKLFVVYLFNSHFDHFLSESNWFPRKINVPCPYKEQRLVLFGFEHVPYFRSSDQRVQRAVVHFHTTIGSAQQNVGGKHNLIDERYGRIEYQSCFYRLFDGQRVFQRTGADIGKSLIDQSLTSV